MNLSDIREEIEILEGSDTTYPNCAKLADLYIVQEYIQSKGDTVKQDEVVEEYHDILPMYAEYCNKKKRYERKEITEDAVIEAMHQVSQEIKEFIQTLYANVDTEQEKEILIQTIADIKTLY